MSKKETDKPNLVRVAKAIIILRMLLLLGFFIYTIVSSVMHLGNEASYEIGRALGSLIIPFLILICELVYLEHRKFRSILVILGVDLIFSFSSGFTHIPLILITIALVVIEPSRSFLLHRKPDSRQKDEILDQIDF